MVNKSASKPATGQPVKQKTKRKPRRSQKENAAALHKAGVKEKLKSGGQPGNDNALVWTEEAALTIAYDLIKWINSKDHNIHVSEFMLVERDYPVNLCSDLCKKYPSFNDLVKKANEIKKVKLLKWAQLNKINVTAAIFDLKCNHGMIETQRLEQKVEHSGSVSQDLSHLSVDELTKLLETATNE